MKKVQKLPWESKPIPSLPSYYATPDGSIYRVSRKNGLIKLSDNSTSNSGYKMVQPYLNGKRKLKYVHQLVLEAFAGLRPEGLVCDHINRDKTDNRIDNLRYVTRSENGKNCERRSTLGTKYKKHSEGKYGKYLGVIRQLKENGTKPAVVAEKLQIPVTTVYYVNSYCL